MQTRAQALARPWALVLLLETVYLAVILALNGGDALAFVTLGECFSACQGADGTSCPAGSEGYDGQFAYYIARDPLGAPDCLDAPAYRLQRILLPALARVLSLGRAAPIPWALVAVNLAALVGGTAALEALLRAERASRWYALSYGLFAGVFMAVRLSTPEPLAYGLVLGALLAERRGRHGWAALALALAALTKETTLFFAAGLALWYTWERRWRDLARLSVVVGAPFVAWQVALYAWLGRFGVGSGGALATSFELIPYNGVWRIGYDPSGSWAALLILGGLFIVPSAVLPSAWALWRALRDVARRHCTLYACVLLTNAAIMPFLPFSTYREFLGLLRFMPGLVIALVLYAAHERLRRPLLYSTLWIVLLMFAVAG